MYKKEKPYKLDEVDALNDVSDFHRMFNLPIEKYPKIPCQNRVDLRLSLLEEELEELKEAIKNNDLVEVADAFCDIQYVLSGAILEFGLGDIFKKLFDEVQKSNMSKICKSLEIAKKTQQYYFETKAEHSKIVERNGEYLVYRIPDMKVLKSIDYNPAKIKEILSNFTKEKSQ